MHPTPTFRMGTDITNAMYPSPTFKMGTGIIMQYGKFSAPTQRSGRMHPTTTSYTINGILNGYLLNAPCAMF